MLAALFSFFDIFRQLHSECNGNTNRMTYAKDCGEAMAVVFTKNGAKCNSAVDIKSSAFSSTMSAAFSQAKPLDMCYIAMQAHGSNAGLSVFSDGYLDPVTLRNEILI